MDGIAVASGTADNSLRRFSIEGLQAAGVPALSLASIQHAVEVMTGAIMPLGTDCVIPLEEYDVAAGLVTLKDHARVAPYRNVQRRGCDSQPGIPMLKSGIRLGAPEIAVVASAGLARVKVSGQPSFAVISTGDELVEPGEPIAAHQVRRSNAYAVIASLRDHGFDRISNDHVPDDERILRDRLASHLQEANVLVLSGGISKGKFDFVPRVLKGLQVREVFSQVAQRPGAPMWFGVGSQGQPVFGLPGNPVSTLICLVRYVIPGILAAMGAPRTSPAPITLAAPVNLGRSFASFVPVSLRYDDLGRPSAVPRIPNGPGDFLSLAGTDGFIELPPRSDAFPEGFVADFYCW